MITSKERIRQALNHQSPDRVPVDFGATAEEVYRQTTELLQKTAEYPNFVISTGCDVPPEIPLENIRAFYQAVEDYNVKL